MGIRASAVSRFRKRVDSTLDEMFPAVLVIGETEVACSGPGGALYSEYVEAGEAEVFRFSFRIDRAKVPTDWQPVMGASLEWKLSEDISLPLEISRVPYRPWDERLHIVTKKRRV